MRMDIVIIVLADACELKVLYKVVKSDAKDSIIGRKLPDLFPQIISPCTRVIGP
jgi:hypothetical protein